MRAAYFIRVALILGWQLGMTIAMFYFASPPDAPSHNGVFVAPALILPFIGHFILFYRSSGFVSPSRLARQIAITLASIFATVIGFYIALSLTFMVSMSGHHY
jgi:hypothetical protein